MSIRRILMLASMALAAIAFAAPASALAVDGELYHVDTGKTVQSGEKIELTGEAEFTSLGTGIRCTIHTTLEATSATTGHVTKFEITTETCEGFGFYEGCAVENPETSVPWHVTVTPSSLDIEEVEIASELGGASCPFTFSTLTFPTVEATPFSGECANGGIEGVELSGEGENVNDFGPIGVQAHGVLFDSGEDSEPCTYGIRAEQT